MSCIFSCPKKNSIKILRSHKNVFENKNISIKTSGSKSEADVFI